MSRARLFSKLGATRGLAFDIVDEATIGRAAESTVRLDDRSVSANHARIFFDTERDAWYVEDLDSLNGTRVDGVAVRGRERLERLHLVDFGVASPFFFVRLATAESDRPSTADTAAIQPADPRPPKSPAPETTAVDAEVPPLPPSLANGAEPGGAEKTSVDREIAPLPPSLAAPSEPPGPERTSIAREVPPLPPSLAEPPGDSGRDTRPVEPTAEPAAGPEGGGAFVLRILSGKSKGLEVRLAEGESVVGRGLDATVRIDASDISRRHAALRVEGGRVFLRDLASRNQTFLDDTRLAPEIEVEARPPVKVRFGLIEAEIVAALGERRA